MPAYDYVCDTCNVVKEVTHGMSEKVEVICEGCGKPMRKCISGGTGFHLQGQGWASKGNATTTPMYTKEYGYKIDPSKKNLSQ